ncbi:hypothetical protein [Halegenticoccus soli]|uniref:hypothetical protein n=1 Tax=Halegenticoccus soli TaxID=1985678 RepID=UPI000C6CAF27|nr:hypothetical protein [Halegenticoccus soli]
MLAYLYQYRRDDAKETVESGDEPVDTDSEEYFGTEEVGPEDEWERVEYGDQTILRKPVTYENVTRVSVPEDGEPREVPGRTIQLRIDGETKYVEGAEIAEITDEDPGENP